MELVRRHPLLSFVLLVVLTPYAVLLPLLLAGVEQEQLKPLKLLFALTPLFYACLTVRCVDGERGLQRLFTKFWNRKTPAWCYAAGIGVFVAVGFASLGLRFFADGFFPPRAEFASPAQIAVLALPLLFFPGITEEFAWRGWLQTGLQHRLHWWWASLITGLVWGSWHGFDFLLGNWTFEWSTFWGYPLFILSNSIIIGWLYRASGESVLVAMLTHFGSNCVNFFMPVFNEYEGSALPAVFYIGGLCLLSLLLPLFELLRVKTESA